MIRLRRLGNIIRVAGKYRLDNLLEQDRLPLTVRALLAPLALFGRAQGQRGERLRKALEELGPIFIKFGQLLSTRPDLIPADICKELTRLQDNVPPFCSVLFKNNIEAALDNNINHLFTSFETEPLASASIAQVHAATLADGQEVVVKAVRPDIEKIIRKDLALLFTLARLLAQYSIDGQRLRPVEVVRDYENVILEELNLQTEGANTSLLRHNFAESSLLYVPEVHWTHSNEKVLVMERIYGIPITHLADLEAAGVDFKRLAERGVEIFFTQVFEHNFFHADMHPGNIFVDTSDPANPSYLAIDCAIMGSLSSDDQFYVARNLLAIFKRDYRQVAELHIRSGWVAKDTSVDLFTSAIRMVCEPIFERPLSDISLGHILINLFSTARRFNMQVQPSLVLLEKTLLNVEGLGRQLYPELDLWTTAQPFLEKWLKERYSPKSLFNQFKRNMPDLLEPLPQIPHMLLETLRNLQQQTSTAHATDTPTAKSGHSITTLGMAITGIGVGLALTQWVASIGQVSSISAIVIGIGVLMMLFRS